MANSGKRRAYRFGEFELDLDRGLLFRADEEIRIRPKSFAVLSYLVRNAKRLVPREELMENIWRGAVVTEDTVTQTLIDVRRTIGDTDQSIVRTVPKQGYLLDIPISSVDEDRPTVRSQAMRRRTMAVAGAIAAAALVAVFLYSDLRDSPTTGGQLDGSAEPAVAVLPFRVLTNDQQHSYLAEGVAEEILNRLARQEGLRVIARTSSFAYRDPSPELARIARELNVTHVLEGSVREEAGRIRVSVQLAEALTGEYLWTESFDRELTAAGLFDIQSEIAVTVVESLRSELTPHERRGLTTMPTDNLEALEAYFEGRQRMETREPAELVRATELFQDAIELDGNFALAYVALADTYRLRSNYGRMTRSRADTLGQAAVDSALQINEALGEAYASLGNLEHRRGDYPAAETAYRKGIELAPNYAPVYQWYGEFLARQAARPNEGVRYSRIAVALDPRSAIINSDYAEALAAAGRLDEALNRYDAAIQIDPELGIAYWGKGIVLHFAMGRVAEAISILNQAVEIDEGSPEKVVDLAIAYLDVGDEATAERMLRQTVELAPEHELPRRLETLMARLRDDHVAAVTSARLVLDTLPGDPHALRALRDHYVATGDVQAAMDLYDTYYPELFGERPASVGPRNYDAAIDLAYLLASSGRIERAEETLTKAQRHLETRPRMALDGYLIADARIHAIRGNSEEALDALEEAIAAGWCYQWRYWLDVDASLRSLHGNTRFLELRERVNAHAQQQRAILITRGTSEADD